MEVGDRIVGEESAKDTGNVWRIGVLVWVQLLLAIETGAMVASI